MKVTQIYEIMNTVTKEILGKSDIVLEDLSNIVDVGKAILDASAVDNYVKALVDQVGKLVFVDRVYRGSAPSVLMDAWEYGSIVEKIQMDMPEATENESWDLVDKQTYNQDMFYKPSVSVKFFNNKTTFEIPCSFTELQVKESFQNATQLNSFTSMIYNAIDKSMTVKTDALIMRTINNFTAATISTDYGEESLNSKSGKRAINLLYLYNHEHGEELKPEEAIKNPEFLRYATATINLTAERMKRISTNFNMGGKERFTPEDMMHIVMLADFQRYAEVYLYSGVGQFNDKNLRLPEAETVPYWQGQGVSYQFGSTSKINVKAALENGQKKEVEATGILAVIFDRDALGVTNFNRRVTSHYNAKAEFYNNWYKMDAGYFNDFNENFVVFFVA